MIHFKHLVLLLIITLLSSLCRASEGIPTTFRFRHYTVDNGMPSNMIRSIMQDHRGFMWFGTESGLCRFDGNRFYTFSRSQRNEGYLPDDYISSIFEDSENRIWLGTDNGVYCYDEQEGKFVKFRCSAYKIEGLMVNNICEDKDHNIWIASRNEGVFKYNLRSKSITHFSFLITEKEIEQIYADSNNNIWVVSRKGNYNLFRYNKAKNCFYTFNLIYKNPADKNGFLCIMEDERHSLWIGSWEKGLQQFNTDTRIVSTVVPNNSLHGLNHIHNIAEYNLDILMIGSDDGLSFYNTRTGEYRLVVPDETIAQALSDKFIYPIVQDKEGGVWIATYYGGINYLAPNTNQFESFSPSRFKNSVSGKVISRFCEDPSGKVWVGSDDGGLSLYNPKDGSFVNYNSKLSYSNVHALCMDGDNLWVGTYTGGLNIINTKTGAHKVYSSNINDKTTLDGSSIYAILRDKDGTMWVTSMTGVNRYNRQADNFVRVKDLEALTIDIVQDYQGNLWFATQGKGVFCYNERTGKWKNYVANDKAMPGGQVNDLLIDNNHTLWMATSSGLCKFNPRKDKFEAVSFKLPSFNVTGIVEENGTLWITTARGLVHYFPYNGKSMVYNKSDGLQSDEFIASSILQTSNGQIYIGSVDGFNAFYPHNIFTNSYIPPIAITEISVLGQNIPIHDGEINLSYQENVFTIQFASLSYNTPQKNKFAYKLEGFDKDWVTSNDQRSATYTNLPAGTYTFKVKGTNNDGVWNEAGTSITIVIHPPFYLTWPFKVLYIIMVLTLVFYAIRWREKQTERKHQENIRELEIEKEKEIHNAKISFFTTIAHEIRTPVSLIIAPLEKLMKQLDGMPQSFKSDMSIINRNSQRLLYLVNQLLDFRKVEQGNLIIHFRSNNIYQLLDKVVERFRPSAAQKGINLSINCDDKNVAADIDAEAITKVVSNLMSNALKFTKDKIEVGSMISDDQQHIIISVVDNGCGIAPDQQQNIFKAFYQTEDGEMKNGTGIGLHIVKTMVEAHNGTVDIKSAVGQGSTFTITLPLRQEFVDDEEEPEELTAETAPIIVASNQPAEPQQKVLLIVEDNVDMLEFLKSNFTDEYQVITAINGKEALDKLSHNFVSLIISDWMMPVMDGIELCKAVRSDSMTSHIPFILLTAKTDNDSKIESMDSGADMHIEKPFSIDYLKACIGNIIELRRMLRQKFSEMPLVPLNSVAENAADKEFLDTLNQHIEDNFANNQLSIDFLADKMHISRSGLFAKIKSMTDTTPNELIQIIRMKKAAQLLLENKYRINEICYMVGFNNPSYFSKCFQKQFGVKPVEFVQSGGK